MSKEYTNQLDIDFGDDCSTLIPVVTQDATTLEVLILAFTNRDAFEETQKTGYVTYYSRTRKKLWRKGETSGNRLRLVEMRINCEQNSLLYLVAPEGKGFCHANKADGTPYRSCFYRIIKSSGELEILR